MSADDDGYQEKSYVDQKREVLEVLSEYIERGNQFINDTMHREEDRREVEIGLSILRVSTIGFYDYLEEAFDRDVITDPAFLNIAQLLRGVIGGSALAFRHLDMPEAIMTRFAKEQTAPANKGKAAAARSRAEIVRPILEQCARKPDGSIKNPGKVAAMCAKALGKTKIDPHTLKAYDRIVHADREK